MKYYAAMICAAGLAVSAPALAQEADPLEHYAAYNEAIEAGDYETASREGEAAWRAAEESWGENGDTATLAYNIAQMRVALGDRAGAQEPAARALELAGMSDGYSQGEAELLYGISLANSDPAQARSRLEAGVSAMDSAGMETDELIRGRLDLAMLTLADDPEEAVAIAQEAVDQSRGSDSPNLALDLADLGRVQYLAGQYAPAMMTLGESLGQWGVQESGELPQPLADAWAWYTMAGRANEKLNGEGPFGPFRPGMMTSAFLPDRRCNIEWQEDEPVNFPTPEAEQVTLGASVVRYDLNAQGQPENIRTVAAAPAGPQYRDFIQQTLSARVAEEVPEGCETGHYLPVYYEF